MTVVEFLDRITPGMDDEIAKTFQRTLKKQGIKFQLKTKVMGAAVKGDKAVLTTEPVKGGDQTEMEADVVLVSTGRIPFTDGLGLENVGIKVSARGQVEVDDHFATNVPGVFAIGDVVRGAMLAHKAEEEGIAVIEHIAGKGGHVNYDAIPNVIYTHPEVATVGKTEEELKAAGIEYNVGKFPFMANSRARANADTDGLVKFLADKTTDKVLGIHIIASNAGEMIAEGVLGMEYGASAEDIGRTCHAHREEAGQLCPVVDLVFGQVRPPHRLAHHRVQLQLPDPRDQAALDRKPVRAFPSSNASSEQAWHR